jgi:hypothetical protein
VDIEEYYDADPRRRDAEERAFGSDWNLSDDPHHGWDLFWNSGTGELYLMAKPVHSGLVGWNIEDAKDDIRALEALGHRIVGELDHLVHPRQVRAKTGTDPGEKYKDALAEELEVEILAVIPSAEEVAALLDGWQEQVSQPDSLTWLRERVAQRQ